MTMSLPMGLTVHVYRANHRAPRATMASLLARVYAWIFGPVHIGATLDAPPQGTPTPQRLCFTNVITNYLGTFAHAIEHEGTLYTGRNGRMAAMKEDADEVDLGEYAGTRFAFLATIQAYLYPGKPATAPTPAPVPTTVVGKPNDGKTVRGIVRSALIADAT